MNQDFASLNLTSTTDSAAILIQKRTPELGQLSNSGRCVWFALTADVPKHPGFEMDRLKRTRRTNLDPNKDGRKGNKLRGL